jgi:hypothetical protein
VTNTETEAFEAMLAHHRALQGNVGILVAALAGTAAAEMIDEHRSLALAIEHLADASTRSDAARQAESISALFAAHSCAGAFTAVAIPSGHPPECQQGGTKIAVRSLGGNHTMQPCRGR